MGLMTYDKYFLKRGYICSVPDCEDDHSLMQPDKRLSQRDLTAMMHDHNCGLVVDGLWGRADLVFPFAVYEAKKRASSFPEAEEQVYDACKMYLAMLDDLARNPDNVAKYQTEESSKHQLFAFVSCGSDWQVFIAWNMEGSINVETIWEGDVKKFTAAFDLICIVDQIHEYAIHQHREFVMKHLEAWHSRHQKTLAPIKEALLEIDATSPSFGYPGDTSMSDPDPTQSDTESDTSAYDYEEIANSYDLYKEPAEWLRLKKQSKDSRRKKANKTRRRNASLRKHTLVDDVQETPKRKRGQGRPPKGQSAKKVSKRGRGRPKMSRRAARLT
ncbi:hypothetical protein JX265_004159 [Neoarthrinium moseri]|uniref:Uncharacterized protein n=1 Tax=Neoarthrinium moseri TaxID=1658444 RepID=A0A9P9WRL6_9PEZI|nr:hypothetical protein JX266_001495 [Neoarthrinium moseri]KAI1876633.1 hypothetical protein JX265_004159 [Neoarthrinium moseri]